MFLDRLVSTRYEVAVGWWIADWWRQKETAWSGARPHPHAILLAWRRIQPSVWPAFGSGLALGVLEFKALQC